MFLLLLLISDWSNDTYICEGYTSYPNQKNIVYDGNDGIHITCFWWLGCQSYRAGYKYYNGIEWTNEKWIADGIGSGGVIVGNPSIAVDGNSNIYTIWQANWKYSDIIIRVFSAGVWADTGIFISSGTNDYNYTPSIVCDTTGNLHIVWQNRYEIYYRKLSGNTLTPRVNISNSGIYSAYPSIETFSNKLFVVWEDLRDGNFEIYLKEFNGTIWQNAIRVTYSTSASIFPCFCIDNTGKLHIVWQEEQEGGYRIFYTFYLNGNFGAVETLVNSPGEAISPSIVAKGNKLWVVWSDSRDGDWEIYYKEYNGTVWGEDTRLTFATGNSASPKIAVDNWENLYLLFWDVRDDTAKVYFKERIGTKKEASIKQDDILISPNPFTTVVRVQWPGVSEKQNINLQIYDLSGRLVKTLNTNHSSLITGVEWDGRDRDGELLDSGVYFLKYSQPKADPPLAENTVRKIVFIR